MANKSVVNGTKSTVVKGTSLVAALITIFVFATGIEDFGAIFSDNEVSSEDVVQSEPEIPRVVIPSLGSFNISDADQADSLVNGGNRTLQERKAIYKEYVLEKKFRFQSVVRGTSMPFKEYLFGTHRTIHLKYLPDFLRSDEYINAVPTLRIYHLFQVEVGYLYEFECTYYRPLALQGRVKVRLLARFGDCRIVL